MHDPQVGAEPKNTPSCRDSWDVTPEFHGRYSPRIYVAYLHGCYTYNAWDAHPSSWWFIDVHWCSLWSTIETHVILVSIQTCDDFGVVQELVHYDYKWAIYTMAMLNKQRLILSNIHSRSLSHEAFIEPWKAGDTVKSNPEAFTGNSAMPFAANSYWFVCVVVHHVFRSRHVQKHI